MMRRGIGLCAWLVLCALACGGQTPPPQPVSFERPERVAFVCFRTDGDTPEPVKLSACPTPNDTDAQVDAKAHLSMHAIVTQTSRGEVGAVDLRAQKVLDSRRDIPGNTFLPVGELPVAIAVAKHSVPTMTYVANAGSRDITVLRTRAFRQLEVGENPIVQIVRVRLPSAKSLGPQKPSDMIMSPDDDALFVTAPEVGWLLRLPIRHCAAAADGGSGSDAGTGCDEEGTIDEDAIEQIPLAGSLAKAKAQAEGPARVEPYQDACDASLLRPSRPELATQIPSDAAKLGQKPVSLALDDFCLAGSTTCKRRLLIADSVLPFIHVVDLDALGSGDLADAVLAPIVTGVPTSAVVVSPRVPKTVDEKGETQYVYAIDATDGSVIATQDGRVLSVTSDPDERADRIGLGEPNGATGKLVATTLEIAYPQFRTSTSAAQHVVPYRGDPTAISTASIDPKVCLDQTHQERDTARLRGVFLAVGASDGTVRIVDIHDEELRDCTTCPYPVVRNRTRVREQITVDTTPLAPQLRVVPAFAVDATAYSVHVDGTVDTPLLDGLECISCGSQLARAYPGDEDLGTGNGTRSDGGAAVVDASLPDMNDAAVADAAVSDAAAADGGTSISTDGGGRVDGGPLNRLDAGTGTGIARTNLCGKDQALICAPADPWVDPGTWNAVFEGALPGTTGGHGRFDDSGSELVFNAEINFCSAGVLGQDAMSGTHDGDQLIITGDLPPDDVLQRSGVKADEIADCKRMIDARADDFPIAFTIRRSLTHQLVIDKGLVRAAPGLTTGKTYALVKKCFADMLMTYEVRSQDAFTVTGTPGFLHRVIADKNNRCVVDEKKSPLLQGRAYFGERYENAVIAFQILRHFNGDARVRPPQGSVFQAALATSAPSMVFDAAYVGSELYGVLPVDLKYNPIDETLYLVDISARGLVTILLDTFPLSNSTSYQ